MKIIHISSDGDENYAACLFEKQHFSRNNIDWENVSMYPNSITDYALLGISIILALIVSCIIIEAMRRIK